MAQVHRFRDAVAVHIGDGQTVYLTPDAAYALGGALINCASDVRIFEFSASPFQPIEIDEGEQADIAQAVKRRKQLR